MTDGFHSYLLDCVTQAVIATDLEGRVTYWNRFAERLYGWTSVEAIGRNIVELTPAPEWQAEAAGIFERLKQGYAWSGEFRVRDRHGRSFIARVTDSPILDAEKRLIGVIGVSYDVTEFKATQEALRGREQQLADAQRSEIALRARQQAALAQVGQFALSPATIGFMFAQAAQIVREILDADYCDIYKRIDSHLLLVGGAGGPEESIGSEEAGGGRRSQAGYTSQVNEPVIVSDLRSETRFTPSQRMLADGVVSSISVAIESSEQVPWGVIGAHSKRRHDFTPGDVDFLRALANTLGQAIERRRAEVELRVRALQQSAIAELGQRVLTSDVDQSTLERACELIMSGLGVEFASYLESDDDGKSLRFRAGQVWLKPPDPIPMESSQAGYAMKIGAPVNVEDYERETRFDPNALFVSHGIRSGLAVPVIGPARKFGVITAQTRAPKKFGPADVHFMESLAAVFADSLTREVARHDLMESEARFRSVVEGASEIIFSVSTTGEIISLNPAFEAITGWRPDEWIGREFMGLFVAEFVPAMRELFESIRREPRPIRFEAHVRGKHRPEILLDAAVSPKIHRGEVIELYGFARDVTEERRLEVERNRLTREVQLILESTDEGIYATDVDGRCTLVNRSAAKLLSASPDWLIGKDMHALIHPRSPGASEQQEECVMLEVVRNAESRSSRDDIFCRADGSPFPVEYTASPIIDRGQVRGAVVTFNDISARRKLESKLEQANRLSSLGRLAATVAHEFNNVLMGISPFAEVLRREPLTERGHTAIDQISRSVKRGKRITEDILRFTQPSEPVLHDFDAAAWLHSMALEARSLIGSKYTLDVKVPHEPVHVIGDISQLHQSFINLILNARDAMPEGGRIGVGIDLVPDASRFDFGALEHPERYAHFFVEDSGHGMTPETLRHIFEPLFTTKKNGTGLGLPVARHVVTRHGGEIFVESAIGRGTKFHLFIPIAADKSGATVAAVVPAVQELSLLQKVSRGYRRVLVVEDERPVASGIVALLELEGVDAMIVETGREVLPAIGSWNPDAVILDIGLPDIDGTKVYAAIAREYPALPVVFSSGHGDESQLEEFLALRNVAFLLKPYDVDTLLLTLDRVVS
jgi:PAS domain S-box-containing protein